MEAKHKHLDFIQAIISRHAKNSFVIKGWTVTILAALLALAAKSSEEGYAIVALLPAIVFWGLDAYFLWQERLFRKMYADVRKKEDGEIDYSLQTSNYKEEASWLKCALATPVITGFYAMVVAGLFVAMKVI